MINKKRVENYIELGAGIGSIVKKPATKEEKINN
tara:strand:- start:2035 stop:2136 length:102 start_codon:yes stop_codon:yes gene_type:complete